MIQLHSSNETMLPIVTSTALTSLQRTTGNVWWVCGQCPDGHFHCWKAATADRSNGRDHPLCSCHKGTPWPLSLVRLQLNGTVRGMIPMASSCSCMHVHHLLLVFTFLVEPTAVPLAAEISLASSKVGVAILAQAFKCPSCRSQNLSCDRRDT